MKTSRNVGVAEYTAGNTLAETAAAPTFLPGERVAFDDGRKAENAVMMSVDRPGVMVLGITACWREAPGLRIFTERSFMRYKRERPVADTTAGNTLAEPAAAWRFPDRDRLASLATVYVVHQRVVNANRSGDKSDIADCATLD